MGVCSSKKLSHFHAAGIPSTNDVHDSSHQSFMYISKAEDEVPMIKNITNITDFPLAEVRAGTIADMWEDVYSRHGRLKTMAKR